MYWRAMSWIPANKGDCRREQIYEDDRDYVTQSPLSIIKMKILLEWIRNNGGSPPHNSTNTIFKISIQEIYISIDFS